MANEYYPHDGLLSFYLAWQINPDNANYNLSFYYKLANDDEVQTLIKGVEEIVRVSPSLRQTFYARNKKLIALIHPELPPNINFFNEAIDIDGFLNQLAMRSHDLNNKSPIHLNIIKHNHSYVAHFNIHHIIMDGFGLDVFITNLNKLVNNNKMVTLEPYDYIKSVKSTSLLNKSKIDDDTKKHIANINSALQECSYKKIDSLSCLHYKKTMDKNLYYKLVKLSESLSISLFNLLLIANNLFVSKLFNIKNSVISYPVNIRGDKSIDGCFVQILPFFFKTENEDTFISVIAQFKENLPLYKELRRTSYVWGNEIYKCPSFSESSIAKPLPFVFDDNQFDSYSFPQIAESILSIKYRKLNNILYFTCDVLTDLFPEYLSETILDRYFHFIQNLLEINTTKILNISLLFPQEELLLLKNVEDSRFFYPQNKSICQIIEEHSQITPDNIALIYNNEKITYFDLNNKANQIARYLINQHKISSHDFIALFFSRNALVIIAMLAVLKTGAAYVSLSKNSPDERIKYVVSDTKAKLILSELKLIDRIKNVFSIDSGLDFFSIDDHSLNEISAKNLSLHKVNSKNLAHVIYTSGTTGMPKGVMIDHFNITSLVMNASYFKATTTDTFVLFADLTFDAATFEIWGALLNGARLFIPTDRLEIFADAVKFKEMVSKYQITILLLTKTIFDQLYHSDETIFSSLQYLLIGGEALNKSLIDKLSVSQHKPAHLINAYGPTENTTISTAYEIEPQYVKNYKTVPIGKAISNRTAYVLDIHKNPLPKGIVGELYVGGDGLSRGYLNQKKLSDEKFIQNSLHNHVKKLTSNNQKLYRTGDLVRIVDERGNLEFLGRNDYQIKIRGYRIEISEIENQLAKYPDIKQTIILASNQLNGPSKKEIYLVAYYTSINSIPINESILAEHLRKTLPEYMIPVAFIFLVEIPKTISGKLDIKILPKREEHSLINLIKPTNLKEKIVCEAFEKVLDIKEIGVNNDFFDLGGNSILAIELSSILHHNFNIHVADVFKLRTPQKIANYYELLNDNVKNSLNKIKVDFINTRKKSHLYRNLNDKISNYFTSIYEQNKIFSSKNIRNIVLTGATGYLGCNILRQILQHTCYNVFLLIRADSQDIALQNINRKFLFYFDEDLTHFHNARIFIFKADLEREYLDIPHENYIKLTKKVDSIIHCAALTKHFGDYNEFYSANVKATINLLELSKQTKAKDFHFISTISTLDNNYTSCDEVSLFTEDDIIELDNQPNFYIKTKYEAEKTVIEYRERGISSNIYRVGNLAFISENFRVQENIDDNAFFSRMKCLLTLKIATKEMGLEEISPVDLTALAIVKIMDKVELSNQIFHVFNPNLCDTTEFLSNLDHHNIRVLTINNFLDSIAEYLMKPNMYHPMIMRFLLHQNWLDGADQIHIINFALQNRTSKILEMLGFIWPKITQNEFSEFIKHAYRD